MPESRSPSIFWTSNVCSSSAGLRPTVRTTLAEWKSARSLLAITIRSYLSACATLHTACASAVSQPTERPIVEEALVTIDSELESLNLEERMLRDGRASLAATRNNSTTLVRTNILPSEILARIFKFSKTYCILNKRGSKSDAFARVCVHWRRTAIAMADLWTHIDIGKTISDSQIKLLLDWSKGSPIHVHALEPEHTSSYDDDETYKHVAQKMMKPLQPHLHRLHILSIDGTNNGQFISAILNLWSSYGYVGTPVSLLAEGPERAAGALTIIRNQGETYENLERMLLAVSNLHLDSARFDWTSSAYRGLVELRLSLFPIAHISPQQLSSILSSCPTLHTLKLEYLAVSDAKPWMHPAPIMMECLEVLTLTSMGASSVGWVLSLMALPEFRTELGISLNPGSEMDERLAGFLARSKLATLHCYCFPGFSRHTSWKYLLKHLPRSHTLVLNNFPLTPKTWLGAPINLSEFLPLFHSIVFVRCQLELEVLKRFVVLLKPQELRLKRCSSSNASQGMEDIRTSLLRIYPELRCSISGTDSTKKLGCRTS